MEISIAFNGYKSLSKKKIKDLDLAVFFTGRNKRVKIKEGEQHHSVTIPYTESVLFKAHNNGEITLGFNCFKKTINNGKMILKAKGEAKVEIYYSYQMLISSNNKVLKMVAGQYGVRSFYESIGGFRSENLPNCDRMVNERAVNWINGLAPYISVVKITKLSETTDKTTQGPLGGHVVYSNAGCTVFYKRTTYQSTPTAPLM